MAIQRQKPWSLATCLVLAFFVVGCGGSPKLGLRSAGDNDPEKLGVVLAKMPKEQISPANSERVPLVFLVLRGKPNTLVAFDLANKKERWRVLGDVSSKIVVGNAVLAHRSGSQSFVGRDIKTGKTLWTIPLDGEFVGAASDREAVYYATKKQGAWAVHGVQASSGTLLWSLETHGVLGAPSARGGLVFSPFMKQWLLILDAKTGVELTRVRGEEEEITFVRTTPQNVFFGSSAGVFALDTRAASGRRAESTYGRATLPEAFSRLHYHWDAFDPIQAGYSAYDRNRILWQGHADSGSLTFGDNQVVAQIYRFFFGLAAQTGELIWSYSHPRVDIVASAQLGDAIGIVSMLGEIRALNPKTGAVTYDAKVDGQVIGATFDALGWSPDNSVAQQNSTSLALLSIARDRDARFNSVKKYAVKALLSVQGQEVSKDLLALIQDPQTPSYLVETAAEVLIARKDMAGVPHLVSALQVPYDYITDTHPRAVGVIARSLGAMDPDSMEPGLRNDAIAALLAKLQSPHTAVGDLADIVYALGRIGTGAELDPLGTFALVYRADPSFANENDAVAATIDVLLKNGGKEQREIISFLSTAPGTQPAIAEYATNALLRRPEE